MTQEAAEIAATLEIEAPADATDEELSAWLAWWRPSYQAARHITEADKIALKAGGWWPPVEAQQVNTVAPEIVRRTMRPGLFADKEADDAEKLSDR